MNINEIAEIAGVSRATVSRYLNNGYISEEKKKKVQKVIEETGYKPSAQAQMLRTKKTRLIGVILPKINSESISRVVAGISTVLSEKGYQLLLANTDNDEKKELEYLQIFHDNQVDGLILVGTIFTKEHKKLLQQSQVPVVIVGQHLAGYSSVYHDDEGAAKAITESMIQAGGKIFGYIGVTERDKAVGQGRKNGFLQALAEANIKIAEDHIKVGMFSSESGYQNAKELLTEYPEIDSILCVTDTIAIGAMDYLKEKKINIPKDVQIVGFGGSKMAKVVTPRLTTVHFAYKTSGVEAAEMLLDMLEHGESTTKEIKMGYRLIVEDSIRR
ncbi:MAG: LacI family DNA-binding transcriptional regulator [Lachnospiraceae bacterium]|nr:LacI family DNA-binding transcriptional regulator [Lachnospiraceae bacterium]